MTKGLHKVTILHTRTQQKYGCVSMQQPHKLISSGAGLLVPETHKEQDLPRCLTGLERFTRLTFEYQDRPSGE